MNESFSRYSRLPLVSANVAVQPGVPVTILAKSVGQWALHDLFTNEFSVSCRELVSFGFMLTRRDDLEPDAAAGFWQ